MDWAALMEGEGSRIEGKENNNNISILSSCGNGNGVEVVKEMMEVIEKVGSYAGFRKTQRKECLNLVRRLKLLMPLLEEIKELHADACHPQPHPLTHLLINLNTALLASKKLLKTCNSGSKIFLVRISNPYPPPTLFFNPFHFHQLISSFCHFYSRPLRVKP